MQRIILLGASNLTLGFPMVLEGLQSAFEGPVEVFAAHGHGRSFGMWSRVLWRGLPGISEVQLWHDLQPASGPKPPLALITDIGNDLLYGADAARIAGWVERCLERLAEHDAQVIVTRLPLTSVRRLSTARYQLTRTFFFPRSGLTHARMMSQAEELDARIVDLTGKFQAVAIEPEHEWYGFDPIHIRRSHRPAAWQRILSSWPAAIQPPAIQLHSLLTGLPYWRLRPHERKIFRWRQMGIQPVLQTPRLTLRLY